MKAAALTSKWTIATIWAGGSGAMDGGHVSLRRCGSFLCAAGSKHPPAVRHWPLGPDQHHCALGVGKAQRQDFRHQGADLPRRKVDDRCHLAADQGFGPVVFCQLRRGFLLSAGLRASGNGSALTIVPTRISTARNCSNEIWGAGDDVADIAVARVSKVAGVQTALPRTRCGVHGRSIGCGLHHSSARFALQLSLLGWGCSCDEFNVR